MEKKHCLIWVKKNDENVRNFSQKLQNWLRMRDIVPLLASDAQDWHNLEIKPDLVVSLGGDGTLLGLGRLVAESGLPVIGINLGHVGFLCVASQENWESVLDHALNDMLPPISCLALRWKLLRKSAPDETGIAINELAITHGFLARMVEMEIAVDEKILGTLRGDGLICYTPLGSSGYNLSAGGPLMPAHLKNIGLTPICTYNSAFAPLILSESAKLEVVLSGENADACITIDGQEGLPLTAGDVITLEALPNALILPGLETVSKANLVWRA